MSKADRDSFAKNEVKYPSIKTGQVSLVRKAQEFNTRGARGFQVQSPLEVTVFDLINFNAFNCLMLIWA